MPENMQIILIKFKVIMQLRHYGWFHIYSIGSWILSGDTCIRYTNVTKMLLVITLTIFIPSICPAVLEGPLVTTFALFPFH